MQAALLSLLATMLATACGSAVVLPQDASPPAQPLTVSSSESVAQPKVGNCPVTVPSEAPLDIRDHLFGSAAAYGNENLWVGGLGSEGVIVADQSLIDDDGSVGMKFGWYRKVRGALEITGRRLDGDAPLLTAGVPVDGYAEIGFIPSGVHFATEGCWEVTGKVGDATLTFVTLVIKQR